MFGTALYRLPFSLYKKKDFADQIGVPLAVLESFYEKLKKDEKFLIKEKRVPKIPLADGKPRGDRITHSAIPALKAILRRIHEMLSLINLPEAFIGGVTGGTIQKNARAHLGNKYFQKIDIADYFPSIKAEEIKELFMQIGCSSNIAAFITRFVTYKGTNPQGINPQGYSTAGTIANIYLANHCHEQIQNIIGGTITITYWSDDIILSSKQEISRLKVLAINKVLRDASLEFNRKKTKSLDINTRKVATGIEITEQTIKPAREKVAQIESTLHQLRTKKPDEIALKKYEKNTKRLESDLPPDIWLIQHLKGVLNHFQETNKHIYKKITTKYADVLQAYKI